MKFTRWGIVAVILIAAIAASVLIAEHMLERRLEKALRIETPWGDTLGFSRVNFGLLGGRIDMNDLRVRWNVPQEGDSLEQMYYYIKGEIGKVELLGLSYLNYLLNDQITVREVRVDSSRLVLRPIRDTIDRRQDTTALAEQTYTINIGGIEIQPSYIAYYEENAERPTLEVQALGMHLEGFHYPQDTASLFPISHFHCSIDGLRYGRPEQLSDLLIAHARGSLQDSSFTFTDLQLQPRYSRDEYSRRLRYKSSRLDIDVATGRFSGLDWIALLMDGQLRSRKFTFDSCRLEAYEDARLPRDEYTHKPLYQEKLSVAPINIHVDSVEVRHASVRYLVRPADLQQQEGFIDFLNFNAVITNITNDSLMILQQPLMRAQVATDLNGESRLGVDFTFDLSSPTHAFDFAGRMYGFDLPRFNTMLRQTSRMAITRGVMDRMEFNARADGTVARGEMRIDYRDLEIEWLKDHSLFAALAQKVVMREANPKKDVYRVGQIFYRRDPTRSFWNYFMQSVLSGLTSTAMPNIVLPDELDSIKEKRKK